MITPSSLPTRLRLSRKQAGLSIKEAARQLAKCLGTSDSWTSWILAVEAGGLIPPEWVDPEVRRCCAEVYDVPVGWLETGDGVASVPPDLLAGPSSCGDCGTVAEGVWETDADALGPPMVPPLFRCHRCRALAKALALVGEWRREALGIGTGGPVELDTYTHGVRDGYRLASNALERALAECDNNRRNDR